MLSEVLEKFKKLYNSSKQVSSTGARALAVFMLLLEGPKTYEEIREGLYECGAVVKGYSQDTLRTDLNILKVIGCDISKALKTKFNRYTLINHPFKFVISLNEIETIKKAYELMSKSATLQKFLDYHSFFKHLEDMTDDEDLKYEIRDISVLKSANIMLLGKIAANEKVHNKIKISYQPSDFEDYEYEISIEKFEIKDKTLYLNCYNHTLGEYSSLNVEGIKRIISSVYDPSILHGLRTRIRFKLYSPEQYSLGDNEIISQKSDDYIIVEGGYYDDSAGIQRMLSFGLSGVVIEPKEIKSVVVQKLQDMKGLYVKK